LRKLIIALSFFFLAYADISYAQQSDEPIVIDHMKTEISGIPDSCIDTVQTVIKLHYAHTSHGGQLVTGLSYIESGDSKYSVARGDNVLPVEEGAFCIYDGQVSDTYISTYEYWETASGMDKTRAVLDANPEINISMWSWCAELDSYTQQQVQAYLDSITVLEGEYPSVTFVYMTGNAQSRYEAGYNRYLRNEEIRQYCLDNHKVLYDFADLDAWWYNPLSESWEQNTYDYGGTAVPVEHEQFNGSEAAHTTIESCIQKGGGAWWMAALIAGWDGPSSAEQTTWGRMKSIYKEGK